MSKAKFLVIAILILAMGLAVLAVFVRSSNPNRNKARWFQEWEKQTGLKIQSGDLTFQWGFMIELEVPALQMENPETHQIVLKADKARFEISLWNYFKRQWLSAQVFLDHPEFFLIKQIAPGGKPKIYPARSIFPVEFLEMNHAQLHFKDETAEPVFEFNLYDARVKVQTLEISDALKILGKAKLYEEGKNTVYFNILLDQERPAAELHIRDAQEKLAFEGKIHHWDTTSHFEGKLQLKKISVDPLIPESWHSHEYVGGFLSAQCEISGEGSHPAHWKNSLKVDGSLELRSGIFGHVNLINGLLRKILETSPLKSRNLSGIPSDYVPLLQGPNMPFEILQVDFRWFDGFFYADELVLRHAEYLMKARGKYEFATSQIDFDGTLVFLESLSEYFVAQIEDLRPLRNQQGRMVIPFIYEGSLPGKASVRPNFSYVNALIESGKS